MSDLESKLRALVADTLRAIVAERDLDNEIPVEAVMAAVRACRAAARLAYEDAATLAEAHDVGRVGRESAHAIRDAIRSRAAALAVKP